MKRIVKNRGYRVDEGVDRPVNNWFRARAGSRERTFRPQLDKSALGMTGRFVLLTDRIRKILVPAEKKYDVFRPLSGPCTLAVPLSHFFKRNALTLCKCRLPIFPPIRLKLLAAYAASPQILAGLPVGLRRLDGAGICGPVLHWVYMFQFPIHEELQVRAFGVWIRNFKVRAFRSVCAEFQIECSEPRALLAARPGRSRAPTSCRAWPTAR